MKGHEKTMRVKIRSFFQSLSLFLVLFSLLGLVYHHRWSREKTRGDSASKNEQIGYPVWQERAPRSLDPSDYENYLQEINSDFNSLVKVADEVRPSNSLHNEGRLGGFSGIVGPTTTKPAANLDDLFISVKTTKNYHKTRLDIILKTWFNLAKKQTWFFTDSVDSEYQQITGNHMINTNCSSSHNRKALCCKMARELDGFLDSNKRWWCHFDDDNYVNVPTLVSVLGGYDPLQDWYLGRPSIRAPLEIFNRDDMSRKISFWFATGGAGFCISRSLALKMMPLAGGGKFISVGEKIRLPDDVTMGYIIEYLLGKKLTIVEGFHSHLEPLRFIDVESLSQQISFGYSHYGAEMNVVSVDGLPDRVDPTRMFSLHCKLFPSTLYCPR